MRSVIFVAFALAMVLAACTSASDETVTSLPEPSSTTTTTEASPPEPEGDEATASDEAYLWSVGDCVDLGTDAETELPYAPYGTALLMDCSQPHTHEVYFTATLSGGSDAPFPEDLNATLWDVCFVEFADVMGFPSSDSTLNLLLYLPDAEEWGAGERYHACVVYQQDPEAGYSPLRGSAADAIDTYLWQVSAGACYDAASPVLLPSSETVACDEEHTFEMIGEAVLGSDNADYPGTDAVDLDAGAACDDLLADYANQSLEQLRVLTLPHPLPFSEGEWESGQRSVRCFAFAGTPEQGLLVVVGSLGEGTFEIVFEEDVEGVQV